MKENRLSLLGELTLEKKKVQKNASEANTTHSESASLQEVAFPSLVHKNTVITQIFCHTC